MKLFFSVSPDEPVQYHSCSIWFSLHPVRCIFHGCPRSWLSKVDMEQNDSLGKTKGLVLSLSNSVSHCLILLKFFFCIVHNKHLETDVPTNQKVVIKYPVS